MAPCVTWASAAMALTFQDKLVFFFSREGFLPPVPSECWETTENINIFQCFLKLNSMRLELTRLPLENQVSIGSDNGLLSIQNTKLFIHENASENIVCEMSAILSRGRLVNSLWLSDAIWRHRSGSTLAQVMACCLTAPCHRLNQCWLIISKVHWHSSEGNFAKDTSATNHYNQLKKLLFSNFFQIP